MAAQSNSMKLSALSSSKNWQLFNLTSDIWVWTWTSAEAVLVVRIIPWINRRIGVAAEYACNVAAFKSSSLLTEKSISFLGYELTNINITA